MVNEALGSNDRQTMLDLAYELDDINNGIHLIDWDNPPGQLAPASSQPKTALPLIDRRAAGAQR